MPVPFNFARLLHLPRGRAQQPHPHRLTMQGKLLSLPNSACLPQRRMLGAHTCHRCSGSQQHTQTACKHQGCPNLCHPCALQTGTTTEAGLGHRSTITRVNMDKLMEGILLTHTHLYHHSARTKHTCLFHFFEEKECVLCFLKGRAVP